jgi:tetratricopeptide (TPR) repeat protein
MIGQDSPRGYDEDLADEVAARSDARWIVAGSVTREASGLKVSMRLIETGGRPITIEESVETAADDAVFSLVDELTVRVKKTLDLPDEAMEEPDRRVADITTHSAEAYGHYLRGVQFMSRLYWDDAIAHLDKAVGYDSTFAMAYYHLSAIGQPSLIDKAVEYSHGASLREQLYIRSRKASYAGDIGGCMALLEEIAKRYPDDKTVFYQLGSYQNSLRTDEGNRQALANFHRALAIDPRYKEVYNALAYLYNELGQYNEALKTLDEYEALAPDEANPHDSRGEIYALNGELNLAIESYKKALEIRPTFLGAALKLANLYTFRREYDSAEGLYARPYGVEPILELYRKALDRSSLFVHQGKLGRAVEVLNTTLSENLMEIDTLSVPENSLRAGMHTRIARILEETDRDSAIMHAARAIELIDRAYPGQLIQRRPVYVRLLAANSEHKAAMRLVREMQVHLEAEGADPYPYWYTAASAEFYGGNPQAAVEHLETAVQSESQYTDFAVWFLLARSYQELGRFPEAIEQFERLMTVYSPDRFEEPIWNVELHYYLGLAYEESGQTEKAKTQYREFLDIWREADSGPAVIDKASVRLVRLEQQP